VYFYLHQRSKALAVQPLMKYVNGSVNRTFLLKNRLEAILEKSSPSGEAVTREMARLKDNDEGIAYIQLADPLGRVLNSTSGSPGPRRVPILVLPASPGDAAGEIVRRWEESDPTAPPEYLVDLRPPKKGVTHMLVGMSKPVLDAQVSEFQRPAFWSALQIAIICVAILAVFSAYIVFLSERSRALNAQLQEESRLAYIGTLAASIAHEVRNPLSSVKMNVQMIANRLDRLSDPEEAAYFRGKVERIQGEVDRLEGSIGHFLAFARPTPLRAQPVRLNAVTDDVLDFLAAECEAHKVQIVRRYARDLPLVQLDPGQFAQAIQNLVINAVQAMGRGGTITVTTEAADGAVALTIADTGPGIPKEIQDKIFEVFFTTREGGTGLGLNIVSRIVEEHRGKLTLKSEPGQGAAFRIELPVAPSAPPAQEGA
jgi:signal transduction histidine kinase